MTFHQSLTHFPLKGIEGLTRWGVFHNLDCLEEEVGFITLHLFGHQFSVMWSRT